MQDALRANDIAAMRQVIADGADINRKDRNGYPYLVMALMYRYYEIAKLLVESGADVNLAGRGNMTAIGRAVSSGNVELVRMLIDRGADVNSTVSPDEITPLHFACLSARMKHYTEEMRTSIVSMLIHAGADPNARDEWESREFAAPHLPLRPPGYRSPVARGRRRSGRNRRSGGEERLRRQNVA